MSKQADRATTALEAYFKTQDYADEFEVSHPEDTPALLRIAITDLVTDLEHLATRDGLDFNAVVNDARANYAREEAAGT